MKITVKLFAAARQSVGRETVEIDLAAPVTIGHLREQLRHQYPELAALSANSMFAIDAEYGNDHKQIPPGATVAWIPPVSGG